MESNRFDFNFPPAKTQNTSLIFDNNLVEALENAEIELQMQVKGNIRFSEAIIKLDETGVLYPNTINMIQGQSGSHKSRFAELLNSMLLNKSVDLDRYISFYRTNNIDDYIVVYIDSERNLKDQLPYSIQKIKEKAGFKKEDEISNFRYTSVNSLDRENRFEAIKQYIATIRANTDKHIIITIDVLTDLINNFNDPKESLKFIDYLNHLINEQDCTIIGVIHENPGSSSKARGHFGTELANKSSLIIQIAYKLNKDNSPSDIIELKFIKLRVNKRPESMFLTYSQEAKGLVRADGNIVQEYKSNNIKSALIPSVANYLGENLFGKLSKEELIELIKLEFDCSRNTAISRIEALIENENEIIQNDNSCVLAKFKEGRKVYFQLKKIEEKLF